MKPELLLIGGGFTSRMLDRLEPEFTVHKLAEINDVSGWLAEHGGKIDAVATFKGVERGIMDALPGLKMISNYGVGYDAVDTDEAVRRDIMVTHTPNVLNADVANMAILLMLAVSRCLVRDYNWVTSGKWVKDGNAPLTRSIEGKKVGILGLGRIGAAIAEKLKAFACDISYHGRTKRDVEYAYYDNLTAMAKDVDYLVAITPGGPGTEKIVNREVMDALGPEGTLINIARGSVVDENELVLALQEGRLGFAGLDVFEDEPNVPEELFGLENVVITPHSASATVETRQAMGDLVVENLLRFFSEGKVTTPVPECAKPDHTKRLT